MMRGDREQGDARGQSVHLFVIPAKAGIQNGHVADEQPAGGGSRSGGLISPDSCPGASHGPASAGMTSGGRGLCPMAGISNEEMRGGSRFTHSSFLRKQESRTATWRTSNQQAEVADRGADKTGFLSRCRPGAGLRGHDEAGRGVCVQWQESRTRRYEGGGREQGDARGRSVHPFVIPAKAGIQDDHMADEQPAGGGGGSGS